MVDDLEMRILAGTAYRIFCEELGKHLEATRTLFITTELSPEQLQEAAARYHTIRGGAGFFKLVELASLAGELERGLQASEVPNEMDHLRELDRQLRAVASTIPHPKQS